MLVVLTALTWKSNQSCNGLDCMACKRRHKGRIASLSLSMNAAGVAYMREIESKSAVKSVGACNRGDLVKGQGAGTSFSGAAMCPWFACTTFRLLLTS